MVERRKSSVLGLCCALVCATATAAFVPASPSAPVPRPQPQPPPVPPPASRPVSQPQSKPALRERWHATLHGGVAGAANSVVTCIRPLRVTAAPCSSVQQGARGRNEDYEVSSADVDADPSTDDSTRSALRLPKDAKVRYARLYWGGTTPVDESGPEHSGRTTRRVLLAAPGGGYRRVKADSGQRHRGAGGADAYQSSADVTPLVRGSGPGTYTVAHGIAEGRSRTGVWGGWTLVAAYENARSPRRHLSLHDGLAASEDHPNGMPVSLRRAPFRPGAKGSVGVVAYDGDRGAHDAPLLAAADRKAGSALWNTANPPHDVFNSTITDHGRRTVRRPAHRNTLGYDSDVLDLGRTLRSGGRQLSFRFAPDDDSWLLGALYTQVEAAPERRLRPPSARSPSPLPLPRPLPPRTGK